MFILYKKFYCVRKNFIFKDYSKWERSNRRNIIKSTKPKAVCWSSAHPDRREAKSSCEPTTGQDGHTASPNETKRAQPETSERFRGNTSKQSSAASSRLSRRAKTNKKEQESISRSDPTQTLELLIKLQRRSVEDLGKQCGVLQELNQQVVRDLEDTDRHSFSSARESLVLHEKLGSSIAALNRWSNCQIRQAKSDLKEAVEEAENHLSGLQAQLKAVKADLGGAQAKLHALKTYKDEEYPAKALQIAEMKRDLEKLKQVQQDEYEEVKLLCQTETARLERQLHQKQKEVMSATAKQNVSKIPQAVKLMVLHNRTMKNEVEMHKKEIMQLEEENRKLLKSIQKLQLLKPNISREAFQDAFPKSEKCSPDTDIHLNIPREEWLPI
ncbi:uncharacterized protein C20orf96 homolog [Salminus brasiliensis]|uniref:uncharacterized protein C20orf96 homolog n=1 Tax=Salminus brasiliensis TaxID=930266 RepID=UPI003B836DAA